MIIFNNRKCRTSQISTYFEEKLDDVRESIDSSRSLHDLNKARGEKLVKDARINNIQILWDKVTTETIEKKIPAERFPSEFYVISGQSYLKPVIVFTIPYTGNSDLLDLSPSSSSGCYYEASVSTHQDRIRFDIPDFYGEGKNVQQTWDLFKEKISCLEKSVQTDVINFNESLKDKIELLMEARRKVLLQQEKVRTSIVI